MVRGDVARVAVSIDLIPGEVCFITSYGNGVGSMAITFDGFTSQFGSTEGEVEKSGGGKVINITGAAESVTPVVLMADAPAGGSDE